MYRTDDHTDTTPDTPRYKHRDPPTSEYMDTYLDTYRNTSAIQTRDTPPSRGGVCGHGAHSNTPYDEGWKEAKAYTSTFSTPGEAIPSCTEYLQYSRRDQTLTFLYLASCAVSVRACCEQSKTHLKTRTKLSEALHIYSTQYKHILLTFADP